MTFNPAPSTAEIMDIGSHANPIITPSRNVRNHLNLTDLAPEMREIIYLNADLPPNPDNSLPSVVVALAAHPILGPEILDTYKKINKTITPRDEGEFKKMPLKELLKIRHLRLNCPRGWGRYRYVKYFYYSLSCDLRNDEA